VARAYIWHEDLWITQLKALGKAFDDGWDQVKPTISKRSKALETARLKLANVVLGLAKKSNFYPQWLAVSAGAKIPQ
jgi:hypothetical protein